MKRVLIWCLGLGILAVAVADFLHRNTGYALVVVDTWRIEMSLNFVLLALLVAFFGGALLLKVVQGALRLPARIQHFRVLRHQRKGEQAFLSALRLSLEGHYEPAIKSAERARKLGFAAGYADLLAARAAQGLEDYERANIWLARVDSDEATLVTARLIQEAEMRVSQHQYEAALQVLQLVEAQRGDALSTAGVRIELRALLGTSRWEDVLLRVRTLRPREGLSAAFLARCRRQAHLGNLRQYRTDQERFFLYLTHLPAQECDAEFYEAADAMLLRMAADDWTRQAQQWLDARMIRV